MRWQGKLFMDSGDLAGPCKIDHKVQPSGTETITSLSYHSWLGTKPDSKPRNSVSKVGDLTSMLRCLSKQKAVHATPLKPPDTPLPFPQKFLFQAEVLQACRRVTWALSFEGRAYDGLMGIVHHSWFSIHFPYLHYLEPCKASFCLISPWQEFRENEANIYKSQT